MPSNNRGKTSKTGRRLRCLLYLLLPPLLIVAINAPLKENVRKSQEKQKQSQDRKSRPRRPFQVGDGVLVQQHHSKEITSWRSATVAAILGNCYYTTEFDDQDKTRKVHIDQLQAKPSKKNGFNHTDLTRILSLKPHKMSRHTGPNKQLPQISSKSTSDSS